MEKRNLHWRNFTIFINVFCPSWTISFISSCALSQTAPWAQRPLGPCQNAAEEASRLRAFKKMWTKPVAWIQVSLYHSPYSECYLESNDTERSFLNLVSLVLCRSHIIKAESWGVFFWIRKKKVKVVSSAFQTSMQNILATHTNKTQNFPEAFYPFRS